MRGNTIQLVWGNALLNDLDLYGPFTILELQTRNNETYDRIRVRIEGLIDTGHIVRSDNGQYYISPETAQALAISRLAGAISAHGAMSAALRTFGDCSTKQASE